MNILSTDVMGKLHEGDLLEQLKRKSGYTWAEIAAGIGKVERSVLKWRNQQTLTPDVKELFIQFFNIDSRAFINNEVRQEVLSNYKSTKVKNVMHEDQVPYKISQLEKQLQILYEGQQELKQLMQVLTKQLARK
jgi:hypothetical protein